MQPDQPERIALAVGQTASREMRMTEEVVREFSEVVGDSNPLHVDAEAASRSRFGRPIVNGMLIGTLVSSVIGTTLPGPGSIYLSQTLRFLAPVFLGDVVTIRVTIASVRADKPIVTLRTECFGGEGKLAVDGEAVVMVDRLQG